MLTGAPVVDVTRLRVAIARLSRRLRKHDLAGLTPTQLAALATVERTGPLRLGDLAAAERIAPSTLTRLVSALEDHGYVQRHAVPADARAWTLAVTQRGHEVLDQIRQENTLLLADSLLTLSPEQLAALAAALPALERLADGTPRHPEAAAATADGAGLAERRRVTARRTSEQQAGQRGPGLGDPLVPWREDLEQPEQVQPRLVPLVARGPPDRVEQPVERRPRSCPWPRRCRRPGPARRDRRDCPPRPAAPWPGRRSSPA